MEENLAKMIHLIKVCSEPEDFTCSVSCHADIKHGAITIITKSSNPTECAIFSVQGAQTSTNVFGHTLPIALEDFGEELSEGFKLMKEYEFSPESDCEPTMEIETSDDKPDWLSFVWGDGSSLDVKFTSIVEVIKH